jgi:hypothetical protein
MTDPVRSGPGVASGVDAPPVSDDEEVEIFAAAGGDAQVADLIRLVRRLSNSLLWNGEAGLRATPEMSRFEATLRAYCVGFLAAIRAVDRSPPES